MINNDLTTRREDRQEHLERLRPVLLADAESMLEMSQKYAERGHVAPRNG